MSNVLSVIATTTNTVVVSANSAVSIGRWSNLAIIAFSPFPGPRSVCTENPKGGGVPQSWEQGPIWVGISRGAPCPEAPQESGFLGGKRHSTADRGAPRNARLIGKRRRRCRNRAARPYSPAMLLRDARVRDA